ncbi:MAG: hypothetical protein EBZ61_07475 [Micrococcales bacterium]|nr:hypothetical protein [Micrococcales bacterium]
MKSRALRIAPPTWWEILGGCIWVALLSTQVRPVSLPMAAFAFFSGAVVVRALKPRDPHQSPQKQRTA